jgi:WD40 repeat protein
MLSGDRMGIIGLWDLDKPPPMPSLNVNISLSATQAYEEGVKRRKMSLRRLPLTKSKRAAPFPTSSITQTSWFSDTGMFLSLEPLSTKVWDTANFIPVVQINSGGVSMDVLASNNTWVSGDYKGCIRLHDVLIDKPTLTFQGHAGGMVTGVNWVDENVFMSGGLDGKVKIWDRRKSGTSREIGGFDFERTHSETEVLRDFSSVAPTNHGERFPYRAAPGRGPINGFTLTPCKKFALSCSGSTLTLWDARDRTKVVRMWQSYGFGIAPPPTVEKGGKTEIRIVDGGLRNR